MAESGWRYTVCTEPKKINLVNTDLDVWACFFVLSKIFEFFDTFLKVLLKKDFIFLHWCAPIFPPCCSIQILEKRKMAGSKV